MASRPGSPYSCLAHGFDFDLDLDLVSDQHATGLQSLVPVEAELLAIHARVRGEDGSLVAPRILDAPGILDVQHDRLRVTAHRELTVHAKVLVAHLLHRRALEGEVFV